MALDQQHWQDRLTVLADEHGVVGASLVIGHGDDTAEAATGVLNLRTQQRATPESVFQIGSISKVWTATLVMHLVDEGSLDLDEPVVKHLPDFKVADEQVTKTVTARQLLAHTSGIDGDLFLDTGRGDDCIENYVAAMARLTQVHPQGATMSYCNSGFTVLGRLIEVLRAKTWDAVLREELFEPLRLTSVGTLPEEALLWGAATGHITLPCQDEPIVTPTWGLYRSSGPAGLIHSTARDLLRFALLHLDGGTTRDGTRVLSAESVAAMQEPQVQVPDPYTMGSHWGLGWTLMTWGGRRVFGHDGGTLGQSAYLRILPDANLTVALCTNGGKHARGLFDSLYGELFAELAGVDLPSRPEPSAAADPVSASRFTGRYAREGVEMTICQGDDGKLWLTLHNSSPLVASLPDHPEMELLPFEHDVLLAKGSDDAAFTPVVFFDLDGERYLHAGARATRRISTEM